MATEMNETFMVRTSTPEMINDDNELSTDKIQTKLTQVQLKATLSDEQNQHSQTQRHQTSSMELVILSKTQDDIVVNYFLLFTKKTIKTKSILIFSFQMLSI
jgi:hypothetical protein